MTTATLVAAVLLAALPAALVPPGGADKRPAGSARADVKLPASLAAGTRRSPAPARLPTRVRVTPSPARVGQRLLYRGDILLPKDARVRFDRPPAGGEFTWGEPRTGRESVNTPRYAGQAYSGVDSAWIEVPLQVFGSGPVAIPGPAIEVSGMQGQGPRFVSRLPNARIVVLPTVTAADTAGNSATWP